MRILITGAAGFIGYHLCKTLLNEDYQIFGIDNINKYYDKKIKLDRLALLKNHKNFTFKKIDITSREQVSNIFDDFNPLKVINLAAQVGVRHSIQNPYSCIDSNFLGFANLIELSRINGVESFIYASSSSVYGNSNKLPSIEFEINKSPASLYGTSKKCNELIANTYSDLYGLNTTGLRFFTVYGPWGRPDMAYFDFTKKILAEEPINVFNNGNMKRDFTFIDDIILGVKSAIEKNYKCEIFNLGNNNNENLMDLIKILEEELSKEAIINFLPMQQGDVIETLADIKKASEKLNFKPKTSIYEGIPIFINWYRKYFN